MTNYHV